jgi:hypothetical protein
MKKDIEISEVKGLKDTLQSLKNEEGKDNIKEKIKLFCNKMYQPTQEEVKYQLTMRLNYLQFVLTHYKFEEKDSSFFKSVRSMFDEAKKNTSTLTLDEEDKMKLKKIEELINKSEKFMKEEKIKLEEKKDSTTEKQEKKLNWSDSDSDQDKSNTKKTEITSSNSDSDEEKPKKKKMKIIESTDFDQKTPTVIDENEDKDKNKNKDFDFD